MKKKIVSANINSREAPKIEYFAKLSPNVNYCENQLPQWESSFSRDSFRISYSKLSFERNSDILIQKKAQNPDFRPFLLILDVYTVPDTITKMGLLVTLKSQLYITGGSRDMEFRHYEHPKNKKLYFQDTSSCLKDIVLPRGNSVFYDQRFTR